MTHPNIIYFSTRHFFSLAKIFVEKTTTQHLSFHLNELVFWCENKIFIVIFLFVLEPGSGEHLNIEMQHNMRLFRAQRNFYISGFAIFLTLVIRRLVMLISAQATLIAQSEASLRQAQSATTAARSLLSQQKNNEENAEGDDAKKVEELSKLKQKVTELETDLKKERKDKEAMKSQSESLNKEYDRLTEEYSKLQSKLTVTRGGKDD